MDAWLALLRTHSRLWDEVESQVRRDHGLTMTRYDVLIHLDQAGGRLGLSDLGTAIVLSPSGLSKLLDRMEVSGQIRREPDPDDARSTYAVITPKGRNLVRRARSSHHALLQERFGDRLTDRDVADLSRVMAKLSSGPPRPGR